MNKRRFRTQDFDDLNSTHDEDSSTMTPATNEAEGANDKSEVITNSLEESLGIGHPLLLDESTSSSISNCSTSTAKSFESESLSSTDANFDHHPAKKRKIAVLAAACWRGFHDMSEDRAAATCNYCKKRFKTCGNTTNAWSHLKKCNKNEHDRLKGLDCSNGQQPKLDKFLSTQPSKSGQEIQDQIVSYIVTDLQPISVVEDKGFRDLIKFAFPEYSMPARSTITNHIEKRHDLLKKLLAKELEKVKHIGVTTDGWTSKYGQKSFSTITLHYRDPSSQTGKPKRVVLETLPFGHEAHTGENIHLKLNESFNNWHIKEKIVALVTDSASSQLLANRYLNLPFFACSAHQLQLAIRDAFKECPAVSEVIDKCQRIVKKFKKSNVAQSILFKAQEKLHEPHLNLLQNVKTRWNSDYYCLSRLIELKEPLCLALNKISDLPAISNNDWQIIEDLILILEALEATSKQICGEDYATISLILPCVRISINHLTSLTVTAKEALRMRAVLVKNMNERFSVYEKTDTVSIASLLDPRIKKDGFKDSASAENAVSLLSSKVHEISDPDAAISNNSMLTQTFTDSKSLDFKKLMQQKLREDNLIKTLSSAHDEIDTYLNLPNLDFESDVYAWWSLRKEQFPRLFQLSQKYLYVPATSAPSERVFSTAGYILNQKRSCLTGEHLDALIFLNSN